MIESLCDSNLFLAVYTYMSLYRCLQEKINMEEILQHLYDLSHKSQSIVYHTKDQLTENITVYAIIFAYSYFHGFGQVR